MPKHAPRCHGPDENSEGSPTTLGLGLQVGHKELAGDPSYDYNKNKLSQVLRLKFRQIIVNGISSWLSEFLQSRSYGPLVWAPNSESLQTHHSIELQTTFKTSRGP